MRCFGSYRNDRTCDMCSLLNETEYIQCKQQYDDKVALEKKLKDIKFRCPYTKQCLEEYEWFTACNKNGDAYGRFAPDCHVNLECEQYCK